MSAEGCTRIPINLDISGPGVRIALYLQSILSVVLVRLSPRDAPGAYWSMTSTSLGLILSSIVTAVTRSISLLDAIIVVYLLLLPILASAFGLSRLSSTSTKSNTTRKLFSPLLITANWVRSVFTYAFALYVWISAPSFGSDKDCNKITRLVFFGASLPALESGRTLNLVIWGILTALFAWRTLKGWDTLWVAFRALLRPSVGSELLRPVMTNNTVNLETRTKTNFRTGDVVVRERMYRPKVITREIVKGMMSQILGWGSFSTGAIYNQYAQLVLAAILAIWAIIMTELELSLNPLEPSEDSVWGFGQILPLILTISPLFALLEWILSSRSSGSDLRILRLTLSHASNLPTRTQEYFSHTTQKEEIACIAPSVFAVVTVDERDVFVTYERAETENPDWMESFDIEVGNLSTISIRLFDFDRPEVDGGLLGYTAMLPFSYLPPATSTGLGAVELPPLPLVNKGKVVEGASIVVTLSTDIHSPMPEPKIPQRFLGLQQVQIARDTVLFSRKGKRWGKQKTVMAETYNLPGV